MNEGIHLDLAVDIGDISSKEPSCPPPPTHTHLRSCFQQVVHDLQVALLAGHVQRGSAKLGQQVHLRQISETNSFIITTFPLFLTVV